jgi:hypothetical protein
VPCTQFSVWRGNTLHLLNLPVPASHHLDDHFSLTLQVNTILSTNRFDARLILSALHSILWFGGRIPPPLLNLLIPASHHLDSHISPTLQVATTLSTNRFDASSILPALHLIFGLVVEYPYTCPIS